MKAPKFPIIKRAGSVVVKVYRVSRSDRPDGAVFSVAWVGPYGRQVRQFGALERACEEAQLKAEQLARGIAESSHLGQGDVVELTEARKLTSSLPLLSVLAEWRAAQDLAGPGGLLPALRELATFRESAAANVATALKRIKLAAAIDDFIAAKIQVGKQGEKTYRSKLNALLTYVGDVYVDTISAAKLTSYLGTVADGVTRNDLRKRAGTLFRWLRRVGYLPRGVETEVDHTEQAREDPTTIGILTPQEFKDLLHLFWKENPQHLAAIVVAGFCGVRADEIHGKLEDSRQRRQLWEDIDLDRGHLHVTNAKTNTPAHRLVPLCPAAIEWLKLCPGDHCGPIAAPNAIGLVRLIMRKRELDLPENCFRHSFITYDVALQENKAATALRAGNSVQEIDRRYRVPKPKVDGKAWFTIAPHVA